VLSSAGGSDDRRVVTGVSAAPPAGAPVAANDSALILEDSLSQIVNILANDTNVTGGAVNLTSLPRLGSATVNPDGTLTYRPNPNANGLDSFTYAVTVGAVTSNQASVSITITPVNDAPVALNDTYSALSNQLIPLSVLSNDTDLDGNADLVGVSNLTQPTPAGAVATVVGNVVNFTASLPGLYTFTYQARDASGALSSAATVNVTVSAAETIVITQAEYRRLEGRLRLSGTVTPVSSPPQVLEIRWANGTNTTTLVTTVIPSAAGAWAIDLRLVTGILNPTNSGATQVVVTGPGGARTVANISFR
jgi:VCBS repeat-containing protein